MTWIEIFDGKCTHMHILLFSHIVILIYYKMLCTEISNATIFPIEKIKWLTLALKYYDTSKYKAFPKSTWIFFLKAG